MVVPTESTLTVAVDGPTHSASAQPLPLERVEAELCTLAGQIAAATSRFLCLLAEFDARDGWAGWGVRSCAHWLSWRCGLDLRTGREYVRVARALSELPHTMDTFGQGRLSYSKVRAISRVATADNEESLVDAALHSPTGQLERLVRGLRTAQRSGDEDDNSSSSRASRSGSGTESRHGVQWRWDDDGDLVVWGRFDGEDGARLLAAATRAENERNRAEAAHEPCQDGSAEPSRQVHAVAGRAPSNLAPALVAAAEWICAEMGSPVHAPGAELVVHVQAETLVETARAVGTGEQTSADDSAGPAGVATRPALGSRHAHVDDGPALLHSALQRLACDSRVRLSVEAADGRTLDPRTTSSCSAASITGVCMTAGPRSWRSDDSSSASLARAGRCGPRRHPSGETVTASRRPTPTSRPPPSNLTGTARLSTWPKRSRPTSLLGKPPAPAARSSADAPSGRAECRRPGTPAR